MLDSYSLNAKGFIHCCLVNASWVSTKSQEHFKAAAFTDTDLGFKRPCDLVAESTGLNLP